MALNAGNAAKIAPLATGVGEAVLTIAQFAVDSTARFALRGNASPSTTTCPNGGLMTLTLTDRDGDGIASAGDRITVESRDCGVPVVTDVVTGTMQIDLGTPTGLPVGSLRAAVSLLDGLRFGSSTTVTTKLLGSMQLDWSSTSAQTALHVTGSAADDLRVVATSTGAGTSTASLTESIRQPDLTKTLKYDEARAVVSLSFRYESEALAGSIAVTTPTPLRAYLNTYPEVGRIEMSGASGSKVVVTPNFVSNSGQFQYALEGTTGGSLNWTDGAVGYLWWDGLTPLSWSTGTVYNVRAFTTTDFFAVANLNWTTASASTVRLQFSRPPASTTPTLYFRFADTGAPVYDGTPTTNIAADAKVQGALVVVKPTTPLRHAHYYTLQISLDGTNWNTGVNIQDALGNSTTNNQWQGLFVTTPDNLRAAAVAQSGVLLGATDKLALSGQTSTSTSRPIVSYRWSQLSGTPLQFENAEAAQTNVSWGATPPTKAELPVIQLTVTDSAGDTDTVQLTTQSVNLAGSSHVLYFRSTTADYLGGRTMVFGDESGTFRDSLLNPGYLQTQFYGSGGNGFAYLALATGDAAALQVGAYENAIRASFNGTRNGIDFAYGGSGCNQTFGRFDVLEIQLDSAGNVTKFAADFEQHCESATAPALLGSYRINSSVPIRR